MSHPDDTGGSPVGKAFSAIRRLRGKNADAPVEPSPAADQSVAPAPRAKSEDAAAVTPSAPADIPGATAPASADDTSATASSDDESDDEDPEKPVDSESESEPDVEPDSEGENEPVAAEVASDEPDTDEPDVDKADVDEAEAEKVDEPVVEPESEPEVETVDEVDDSPAPSLEKTTTPEPAPVADDTEWRSDTAAPQYIPASSGTSSTTSEGRSRKVVLWIASIAVIVVAIAAVVVAVFATRSDPATPAADLAADAATKYTTALSNGDLTTLRTITCGERKQFYDGVSPEAFRQQFETQKANNELVGVRGVRAARVVDPTNAIVEVTAFSMSNPEKTTDVALRLRKDGDDWKVCTAG